MLVTVFVREKIPRNIPLIRADNRWKIENSWGDKVGHKGYYVASDTWFDKYVYVVAINKKYLSEKALKALEGQPTLLKPWDPFGTLAD